MVCAWKARSNSLSQASFIRQSTKSDSRERLTTLFRWKNMDNQWHNRLRHPPAFYSNLQPQGYLKRPHLMHNQKVRKFTLEHTSIDCLLFSILCWSNAFSFFQLGMIALPSRKKGGIVGAMGFGPGPLANGPRLTKDYNWVDPSGLTCEPDLRAETQISSFSWKGVDILRMPSLPIGDFI